MKTIQYAYTKSGAQLELRYLGDGAEGTVYEMVGYANRVAKIYKDEPADRRRKRERKIEAMVAASGSSAFRQSGVLEDIAWPLASLYDQSGNFIGFGMKRIAATTELDDLYEYPPGKSGSVRIRNRVKCLINLCDVIDRLHQIGQVFGDFNPNNIKIGPDWKVSFVDADSYHVRYAGNEYRCIFCAPGYVAPELLTKCKGTTYEDYPGTTFTSETDRFALAIHIFRMLMNGVHPYICRKIPKNVGSLPTVPTDDRVERGETPFFKSIPNYTVPVYAPDVHSLPPYLQDLFRKAFVDGHTNPAMRPATGAWKQALLRYSQDLVPCSRGHDYWRGNTTCPYCQADQRYLYHFAPLMRGRTAAATTPVTGTAATPAAVAGTGTAAGHPYQTGFAAATPVTASPAAAAVHSIPIHQAAQARANCAQAARDEAFMIRMLVTTIVLLVVIWASLTNFYTELFDDVPLRGVLTFIGIWGTVIASLYGVYHYCDNRVAANANGTHAWWEYLIGILVVAGCVVGYGVILFGIVVAMYICVALFAGVLLIAMFL